MVINMLRKCLLLIVMLCGCEQATFLPQSPSIRPPKGPLGGFDDAPKRDTSRFDPFGMDSGVAYFDPTECSFAPGDHVKLTKGFYKGSIATVIDHSSDGYHIELQYRVAVQKGECKVALFTPPRLLDVPEDALELVKKEPTNAR